jgi:hypothetical protein
MTLPAGRADLADAHHQLLGRPAAPLACAYGARNDRAIRNAASPIKQQRPPGNGRDFRAHSQVRTLAQPPRQGPSRWSSSFDYSHNGMN